MRILYHHRTLADGAEGVHIAAMVDAFRSMGHDVRVLGVASGEAPSSRSSVAARIKQAMPAPLLELAALALNVPEYVATLREIGRFRPDLLYKRHGRFDVAALAAARRAGVPVVLEVNSLFTQGAYHRFEPLWFSALAARLERRALELATVVAAVSTPLVRQCRAVVPRDVLLLPNGTDPDRFTAHRACPDRARQRCGLGGKLTVGWTGILREWHGVELLLDAASSLPHVHVLIVGDGPSRERVERRAASLGVAGRVTITGRIPHHEMPDYIAAMDVAVVADEQTGVASPMKLLEYMAMERAVVAPRIENITDIVTDGIDGLLFDRGDRDALCHALHRLADDPALRSRLGRKARIKIEQERNWNAIARTVLLAAGTPSRGF